MLPFESRSRKAAILYTDGAVFFCQGDGFAVPLAGRSEFGRLTPFAPPAFVRRVATRRG